MNNEEAQKKLARLVPDTQRSNPRVARIEESACIGCTKCIQACPFDTIVGAAKLMHTVIETECTGCGLCVDPCPVDCISLPSTQTAYDPTHALARLHARKQRQEKDKNQQQTHHNQTLKATESLEAKQTYIAAALARVKAKQANKASSSESSPAREKAL